MVNISELSCRVCLQEEEVLINIYDELEDLNTNLSNLLDTCANLQINENDNFPKYLCDVCTRELLITSEFRKKCDKSKEILKNYNLVESEQFFNSNDIIEYCSEDSYDAADANELLIQGPAFDDVHLEQDCQMPLRKAPIELGKFELSNSVLHETVIEEYVSTEDCSSQLHLAAERPKEIEGGLWDTSANNQDITTVKFCKKTNTGKAKKSNNFKCDVCGAIFKQAINLQKHIKKLHAIVNCFICSKCNYCFSLETEYQRHINHCNIFKSTKDIDENIQKPESYLGNTVDTRYIRKCMYCQRDFPTPFALRMHLRTHTGERPFQCKYCIKSFKTQSQLNVHHKRHIGQADFICTVCNKSFYEQSNLTVHMRSHTGERPHVCSICNKTFARVFLLQFHMRTHTGEKPFKCSFCNKNFRQHTDLRNHITIHTGIKQHTCSLCGKSYIKRSHLVQHINKHHAHCNAVEIIDTAEKKCRNNVHNPEFIFSLNDIVKSKYVQNTDNISE